MVCVSGYTPSKINFVNNTKAVSSLKCMRTPPLIKGPSYIHGEEYQITPEMRTPPLIRALFILLYIYICIEQVCLMSQPWVNVTEHY